MTICERDSITPEVDIKTGDLIAWSTRTGLYNKLIRLFTLSEYTHVGVAVIIDDELYVVEAVIPSVRMVKLNTRTPFQHIPMGVREEDNDLDYLYDFIGKKYSRLQAILSMFDIYINDDKWYCSELCYEYYKRVGIGFEQHLKPTDFVRQAIKKSKEINYIESL